MSCALPRPSRRPFHVIAALVLGAVSPLGAMQAQPMTVTSPITGQNFEILGIPAEQISGSEGLAGMGADDDGCRHTSGISEYDYYVAMDPYSYFAALTVEWDTRSGRFRDQLTPDFKAWVQKEFNGELVTDRVRGLEYANQVARAQGQPPPDRSTFVLPQQNIPPEKRYRYALLCYQKRGARPSAMARVALTGAWAIRARLNVPVGHTSLDGGYQEVNDQVVRRMKDNETFSLAKWLPAFKDIFESGRLTNEGSLVAGLMYFGYVMRDGTPSEARAVLDTLTRRLAKVENGELMRGLVRERKRMLDEYITFLDTAWSNFIQAIADEEVTRRDLPTVVLVVAESLRRTGNEARAIDWYLALAKMPESQPKLREQLRASGKAPSSEGSPFHVQQGWIADLRLEALRKAGAVHPGEISGPDKRLLAAVIHDGLGTADYKSPTWTPATGGNQLDCQFMLDHLGKAVLDFCFREKIWPKSLGEMWEQGAIKDRNRVNRFHCPVTGAPFAYHELSGDIGNATKNTILIATSKPVPSNQGEVYGGYLAKGDVVWSAKPLVPGQTYSR